MFTQDYFEKHFKLHNKIVLYTPDDIKLEFTKEPHFHMSGGHTSLDLMDVDKMGLDHIDRNLLRTMIEKFDGGPVGLDTLAAAIGEDAGTIEDVYEPFLIQNGLLNRTPRGRVATDLAYRHMGLL